MILNGDALVVPECPYFRWKEFSGWNRADAQHIQRAQDLVRTILCPAHVGLARPIRNTSWYYSAETGMPREGVHGTGAGDDIVPGDLNTPVTRRALYEWIRDRTAYGEVILEEYAPAGPHVHVTLPGFGGEMQALVMQPDGSYATDAARYVVAGVSSSSGWPAALVVAGLALAAARGGNH